MLETPRIDPYAKNGTMASFGNDANNFAEFTLEAELDQFASDEGGIPVYHDVEMITIYTPGNNKQTFKAKVTELHKQRFPKQWEAFKAHKEQSHDGLPLTEWPVLTKAQALNLKGVKVFTVEQLAQIPDTSLGILGLGGRETRDKAIAYLSRTGDSKEITKLFSEIKKLQADNAALREMIENPAERETLKLKKG